MVRTVVSLLVVLCAAERAVAQSQAPVPQFFGVYARADGKLTELTPSPNQMASLGIQIGGADLIRNLSSKCFSTGTLSL